MPFEFVRSLLRSVRTKGGLLWYQPAVVELDDIMQWLSTVLPSLYGEVRNKLRSLLLRDGDTQVAAPRQLVALARAHSLRIPLRSL